MDPTFITSQAFLLLLFFSPSYSSLEELCNLSGDMLEPDDICRVYSHNNGTGLSDSVISPKDVEFILHSNTSGILEIKFPILKQYVSYELRLNVKENVQSENECNNYTDLGDYSLHSKRSLNISSCKDDTKQVICDPKHSCTKYTSVIFNHVFGGCYMLHISPRNNAYSGQPTTHRKMIHSVHNKTLIWDMRPAVAEHSYPNEHRLTISNLTALFFEHLQMSFHLYTCENYWTYPHWLLHWVLSLNRRDSTQLQCKMVNNSIYRPSCEVINTQSKSQSVNSVACTFYNMTPGNYCVVIEPLERDRCNPDSVWTPRGDLFPCRYKYTFSIKKNDFLNQSSVPFTANHKSNTLVAIGSIGAFAAFVILGIAVFRGICGSNSWSGVSSVILHQRNALTPKPKINSKSHVLLLYAQDCQPFMKVMGTLRCILSKLGKCEVLDCFDPACAEFVAPCPEEWMRQAASHCLVILVIGDCGAELQNKRNSQQYRCPLPYCHLFLVGLQQISSCDTAHEYCRVFVVRFDGQDINFITPHIRFVLPHNLCDLMRQINPNCDADILEECKDNQKLKDDVEEFLRFKNENPNYVKNLMMIEESI